VYLRGETEGELGGSITADDMVKLHWDRDQAVDLKALSGVLDQPRVTAWSGITIAPNEGHDGFWLRLTVTDQRVCRISAHADAVPEVVNPIGGYWRPALVDGGSLAYLTARRLETGDGVRWELGAIGHGPAAAELTEHLCDEARAWSPKRDQYEPRLVIHPAGTPDDELAGPAFDKTHSRFVFTYDIAPT
jgi:protein-L-isoaspartate(D-aspartate) O-methyltransferase